VLVDPDDGTVLTGVADGRVLRLHPRNGTVSVVADTGGRPMGLEWLPDGRLLVCDARRGLLAIDTHSGTTEVLATQVAGQTLGFCNSASVAPDGTIWFSDSSSRFGIDVWKADILEHSGTGRLLRRDVSGECEVVTDGLQFANGVALTDDPTHVVVAETGSYALSTCPTRPGTHRPTPLLTNLPGFPDNIATGTDGLIWVALASPRDVPVSTSRPADRPRRAGRPHQPAGPTSPPAAPARQPHQPATTGPRQPGSLLAWHLHWRHARARPRRQPPRPAQAQR